jgi:hypothetical protein
MHFEIGHSLLDIGLSRVRRVGEKRRQVAAVRTRRRLSPQRTATCATAPAFEAHASRPERSAQPTTRQPVASDRPEADLCNANRYDSCCVLQKQTAALLDKPGNERIARDVAARYRHSLG